ncbi:DUF3352 domain-containing protein [Richelia sinica]|uniref:DUF3352 domain-containing protein n=1 Tax=Richelia sinica TaxID=1357545 RepID=UPI001687C5A8|nr:DUF3352 domain-containing protein [Richelia sinica]MBD2663647.1 DUF3352 domain-containing protein [Richelia sinica FACHB-800]
MALPVVSAVKKENNQKPSSLAVTLSTAGLLICIGIPAYRLFTQGQPLSRDLPVGVNMIPQDALFAVSLSTDPKQWQQLRKFGTPETQGELDKNLTQWRDRLQKTFGDRFLTDNGYNFQTDIQPWVGDAVTIAMLAPPSTPNSTEANSGQSMMMVMPIKNIQSAKSILAQPKALKQGQWVDRTYQGITIKQAEGQKDGKISAALIDERFLVIADSPQITERAIDAYKNKVSLANSPGFADNFSKLSSYQPFAQFYVNLPLAARIATSAPNRALPAQVLTQLQNNQGLGGTVTLEPEGMRIKGVSWLNPNSQKVLAVENKAGNMQNRLPGETLMMLSGSNLQRLWGDYVSTSQGNPLSPLPPEQLRQGVKSLTNLDLEQDLLSWMKGEFSVSVIPNITQNENAENFRAGLALMVQVSDRQIAENALQKLDEAMKSQYQFQIQPATVGGKPVINWIAPFGTLTATRGWLDGDVAFFTLGAPVSEKIISQPSTTLASTQPFQQTVPTEINHPNSQFFLDVDKAVNSFSLNTLLPNQKNLLAATRTIGVTTAVNDKHSNRYDIFITLKKNSQ